MKFILLLIVTSLSTFAQPVNLTDTKGRSLICEIISTTETEVSIRNPDGKVFSIQLSRLDDSSRKVVKDFEKERKAEEEDAKAELEEPKPKGLVVASLAIKRIEASSIGGTFRYFFAVRNYDASSWAGTVKIRLIQQNGLKLSSREFAVSVAANGGANSYFEASVGPPSVHGEYGVVAFEVEAADTAGKSVTIPGGKISSKYSDIAE